MVVVLLREVAVVAKLMLAVITAAWAVESAWTKRIAILERYMENSVTDSIYIEKSPNIHCDNMRSRNETYNRRSPLGKMSNTDHKDQEH